MLVFFASGLVVGATPNLKPLLGVVDAAGSVPKLNPVVDAGVLEELSTTPNLKPEPVTLESLNFLNKNTGINIFSFHLD